MDPCHISEIMFQAAQRRGLDAEQREALEAPAFSKADARMALSNIDAQTVIESMLSREWGNADDNTRWRAGRRQIEKTLSALPVSGETSAFAETVLYRQLNNQLASPPGAVASPFRQVSRYYKDLDAAIDRIPKETLGNARRRWRNQIERIILMQEKFTRLRMEMDKDINVLAAAAILAPQDLERSYDDLGEKMPTNKQFAQVVLNLIRTLRSISVQTIEGEPSERNNLDACVRADQKRLQDLLRAVPHESTPDTILPRASDPPEATLQWAMQHIDEFRNLVTLAQGFCDVQTDALLNKLSRAYQKPDFCIRRDSVGSYSDQLLPLSLSWDADWYYGRNIKPDATNRGEKR
jgi:hypothetical protein